MAISPIYPIKVARNAVAYHLSITIVDLYLRVVFQFFFYFPCVAENNESSSCEKRSEFNTRQVGRGGDIDPREPRSGARMKGADFRSNGQSLSALYNSSVPMSPRQEEKEDEPMAAIILAGA